MKYLEQDEIDLIATTYINLQKQARKSKSPKIKKQYQDYQTYCIEKLGFLVRNRSGRYRQFPNYPDLEQDGYEALLLALKTYDPKKGSFSWWADKYINTRVSRAANAHSTIRVPITKARTLKPHKTMTFPLMIDQSMGPQQIAEQNQNNKLVRSALEQLSKEQQIVVASLYGINGIRSHSIKALTKRLDMSRSQCLKLLEDAKIKLKSILNKQI